MPVCPITLVLSSPRPPSPGPYGPAAGFVGAVQLAVPDTTASFDSTQGPPLIPATNGNVWIVTQIAAPLAGATLWQMLLDRTIFGG